jgi:predicted SnoaL-like aldol condensation-catalyzing enzyme
VDFILIKIFGTIFVLNLKVFLPLGTPFQRTHFLLVSPHRKIVLLFSTRLNLFTSKTKKMKSLFLTIVGAVFSVLMCNAQATDSTNLGNENTMKVYHAIETGDLSNLDQVIDANIVDHTMQGDVTGLDAVKNMFTQMHDHIDNISMKLIAGAYNGDYHFALSRMTGTTNSEFMGMPANTPIDMTNVDVVRVKDGKAVEHWEYIGPKEAMEMMNMHHEMPMDSLKTQ